MEEDELPFRTLIFVCTNQRDENGRVACANPGHAGAVIRDKLKEEAARRGLKGVVRVSASGCMDVCEKGPNIMVVGRDGTSVWYHHVAESDIPAICDKHMAPR